MSSTAAPTQSSPAPEIRLDSPSISPPPTESKDPSATTAAFSQALPQIRLDSPPTSVLATNDVSMASPSASPEQTTATVTSPSPVFAPRPVRMPTIFRPIPRSLVMLEGSGANQMRKTPPPLRSSSGAGVRALGSPISSVGRHHRRTSSASGDWNLKNLVLTEPSVETPGIQVLSSEAGESERAGELSPVQLYSPSKDVLDELYKIIRNNRPGTSHFDFRGIMSSANHRRQWSDASSKDGREEATRSPSGTRDGDFGRIVFPSSPVSRTTMRNPIIFNSQFGQD